MVDAVVVVVVVFIVDVVVLVVFITVFVSSFPSFTLLSSSVAFWSACIFVGSFPRCNHLASHPFCQPGSG